MVKLMDRKKWQQIESDDKIHIVPGLWYFLDDDDLEIAIYWGSLGKQVVFVNGETVHKQRAFGYNSWIKFSAEGKDYELVFISTRFITGEHQCLLIREGQIIDRTSKSTDIKIVNKLFWIGFIVGFLTTTIGVGYFGFDALVDFFRTYSVGK